MAQGAYTYVLSSKCYKTSVPTLLLQNYVLLCVHFDISRCLPLPPAASRCLPMSTPVPVYFPPTHHPARSIHNLGNLLKKAVQQCVKDLHYDVCWPWMLGVAGLQFQTGILPLRAVPGKLSKWAIYPVEVIARSSWRLVKTVLFFWQW